MIIGLIQKLLTFVTDTLFSVIDIPIVPPALVEAVNFVISSMYDSLDIVNFFCPISSISPIVDFFILIWTVDHSYRLVMWVLQKIPMLNIK